MQLEPNDLARLCSQTSRAELVLFTGAGFSLGAKDRSGRPIPSSGELKRELWALCYPDAAFDESSSLGDLYSAALRARKTDLIALLEARLTVDPDSLPNYYESIFNFPWLRCYTLNVDDLDAAVARRFKLERAPIVVPANEPNPAAVPYSPRGLEVVHLNGVMPGPLDALTFSETQYAERIGNQEPWYSRCVVDLMSRPVIFIGTVLSESLLWHHMFLRRRRENLGRDLRPTSVLVTKDLSLPRRDILRDLRINWVAGTAEEFANEILPQLAGDAAKGFAFIKQHSEFRLAAHVPLVSELATERPKFQTEYLLGEEPQWADLLSGRAIQRAHDESLLRLCDDILNGKRQSTAVALTGTAGSGKSTGLMSLALRLSGNGIPVLWVDKDSEVSPFAMRTRVRSFREKVVLAIDDADMYGRELVGLLHDLVPNSKEFLFIFGVRSNKLDAITGPISTTGNLSIVEHVVPPLTDEDIDALIAVLEKNNRLGLLTGATPMQRRRAFRDQAGRQLLVAMIQATSNENFERKAQNEYEQLEKAQKYPYALIAVATALRHALKKDEILLAQGDSPEETLLALERLTARHLVISSAAAEYRSRHRVIAELVFGKVQEAGELSEVMVGLTWALASKLGPNSDRYAREAKLLVRLISHDFLLRTIGFMSTRALYTRLEPILSWYYHFWLQRGSLEVEAGDNRLAENFLGAARSLGSGDFRVDTAYSYMLMRKAWEAPSELHAEEHLEAGIAQLEEVIDQHGQSSPYPYHVLGTQALRWIHRSSWDRDKKREFLQKIYDIAIDGLVYHQRAEMLLTLRDALQRELLLTVVNAGQAELGF